MTGTYEGPALLHVGFPKTGTTALQNDVFSRAERGMGLPAGTFSRACLIDWFVTCDGYVYDPAAVAREMADHEAPLREQGVLPVWSDETLLGNPLDRRYDGAAVLDRIAALKRPFRVLITIREQRALAVSLYREFVKAGGSHGLTDFLGTGQEAASFTPILRPEYLFYDRPVRACIDRFGADNVLVLPQELMVADPQTFLARLGDFLGRDLTRDEAAAVPARHNVGTGALALELRRGLNRFIVRSPLHQGRSLSDRAANRLVRLADRLGPAALVSRAEGRLRARVARRYEGVFVECNRALEAVTGLDLQRFGYQ